MNNLQVISTEQYEKIYKISFAVILILAAVALVTLVFTAIAIKKSVEHKRKFRGFKLKEFFTLVLSLFLVGNLIYSLYLFPGIFFNNVSWNSIEQYYPKSFMICIYMAIATMLIYFLYFMYTYLFPLQKGYSYFSIITLSIISGGGYAFLTFIINTALAFDKQVKVGMIYYFFVSLLLYIFILKYVRVQLTNSTNNYIYDKRMEIIGEMLNTPYECLENMGKENIYTCLNNDTETVSSSISIIVSGMTSLAIIGCCLVYLAISNIALLSLSAMLILAIFFITLFMNRKSNKNWECSREDQNIFFRHIEDLIYGFKELCLKNSKRKEFHEDLEESCNSYKKARIKAEYIFAYIPFASEFLVFSLLAVLIFILPLFLEQFKISTIREFIIIFILIKGHFDMVLTMVPKLSQVKVSLKRINKLIEELSVLESEQGDESYTCNTDKEVKVQLAGIEYSYKNSNGDNFKVGPIECEFNSGEITFIAGGNGSGKSTLAKLLTGLYAADKGEILVNGKKATSEYLGEQYSAIFSDYYLFQKFYGINYKEKNEEINQYLKILNMNNKLSIIDGKFSTVKLSTGQRKRMALLISYLEDSPIYLLDEWAADQDPEFKKYFYLTLLPKMKFMGKCVIAITHDDRYFGVADKVIKIENGKIINIQVNGEVG